MGGVVVVNGVKVRTAQEQLMTPAVAELDGVSNVYAAATNKKAYAVPQKFASISYMQGPGNAATGKIMYFVVNALNDVDAAFKLATPGLRRMLSLGDVQQLRYAGGINRIDFASAAAESGSSKLFIASGF